MAMEYEINVKARKYAEMIFVSPYIVCIML